jgi:glutathione synthase/RimK-type ligase-like ATP-grasp enzyme
MRVGLATAAHLPSGSEDDQVLIEAMRGAGFEPVPVIWDQPQDWAAFDVIILRSIWDYHLKYPRFLEWLDALDQTGVPVHNSTSLVRWNADKKYMLELEQKGVRITPSRIATAHDDVTLAGIAAETGWRSLVVKPTVASTGYETWLCETPVSAEAERQFSEQRRAMNVLVQEYAVGVQHGEISMVFLNGAYSHSVLKRAVGSEFRVHIEHGGTVETVVPDAARIAWAESVVAAAPEPWTYARVDLVTDTAGPLLMELELLDPELFFKYEPASAARLITSLTAAASAR